jgi:hypothetical protein
VRTPWGGGVGPIADPAPWADAARAATTAAFTPAFTPIADPAPWPWGGPVLGPRVPFPFPFPWPRPGDPGPEDFAVTRGGRGPVTWPIPGDPGPSDLAFQTRTFAQSLETILRAGGLTDEQMGRASVADLVGAYQAAVTPPVAKAAVGAFTAAQVAELDKNGLERLALLITSETERLASLKHVVEARAKELKK